VPVASSRPGIFVCGTFQAPKDIPESVTEASAAAACCRALLGGPLEQKTLADAPNVPLAASGTPRLGVLFCGWGPDIADLIDGAQVREYAAGLPGVILTAEHPLDCSPEGMAKLAQQAAAAKVNRVVLAACSPMTGEPRLKEAFRLAGINKYLVETVNIRGEAAWVHPDNKAGATAKAKELVRAAAARVLSLKPLTENRLSVEQQALVVGGGVAGMSAALNLAQQGIQAYIIEKGEKLGGLARRLHTTIEGIKVGDYLDSLIQKVTSHPKIGVLTETEIVRHLGTKGNFLTTVASGAARQERALKSGAIILATGAHEYRPTEYLYGRDPRVMTQLELEEKLQTDPDITAGWERAIMIQCVGSRNAQNPNCSRICCQSAVKHALQLKEKAPGLDVVIFHRDVRLYGLLEDYYIEARDKKILFERFDPANPPKVASEGGRLQVTFRDHILERDIRWPVDAVILSAAVVAADTAALARMLKVKRDDQGFWLEAHPKMRPVDLATEGYYVCGTGHSPRLIKEAVTQGLAAASRAGAFLAATSQVISPIVAEVEQGRCVGCLACVRTCPYQVPQMSDNGRSEINPALCLGCGVCAGVCPAQAINFSHYTDEQLQTEMSA
jgi:heterodisulfide reductase subunit A-like polyferredoxin